jgi:hypothetical protein
MGWQFRAETAELEVFHPEVQALAGSDGDKLSFERQREFHLISFFKTVIYLIIARRAGKMKIPFAHSGIAIMLRHNSAAGPALA